MIFVRDHQQLIDRILSDHGLCAADLEIVADVQEWCEVRGIPESNPSRMAKCFCKWDEGKCYIVLADRLSAYQIAGGKGAMDFYGLAEEVRSLDTPEKFLIHLVLHEVAAHVLKTVDQKKRDLWAFEQMKRYTASPISPSVP